MAQLQKLFIQGIRSFGPDDNDKQVIVFSTPLTLILGQNGCGKTTIIEALKYAITGDLPPGGRQGQAFVYDPKLARQPEVRGKVQLKIKDVKGRDAVVTRCVQVTQKKATMQFKSLDASISRRGVDGAVVQTSGRCVDIDIEMATSMGVSKSVINNVILCHQEDSAWPLEDGKKLKERFDAIFDTVKHNKCLSEIHDLRKTLREDVKILTSNLSHLHDKKEAAQRLQEEMKTTEGRINVAQDQVDKCQSRCRPIDERLGEIQGQESIYVSQYSNLEKVKTQISYLREQQERLKKNISKRFEGSVEELKDSIASFQGLMRSKDIEHRDLCSHLGNTKKEEEKLNEEINLTTKKIGQLESQVQIYQKYIQERNKNLENLRQNLKIEGASALNDADVRSMMEKVEQKVLEKGDNVEKLHHDQEREEQRHQSKADSLRDTKVKKEQEVKSKEEDIESNNANIKRIRLEIKEAERAANRLAQVENDLSDVENRLEQMSGQMNVEEQKENIKRFEDDEHRVGLELEKMYKEVQQLQQCSETRTRLTVKQAELNNKMAELNRLKNKNGDALKHLLGSVPDVGLKRRFDVCLEQIVQDINGKNYELRKLQNEISKIEVNRRHKKEQLDVKEKELKDDEEKIYEHCEDRDLEDVIKDLDDKIQEMRNMKGMLASQEVLFQKYVQKLQEKDPCCPLCHRNFERSDEAPTLIDELRSEVRTVPSRLKANNEKLEKSVREYDRLLQLRSTNEHVKIAKETAIPKLKKDLKEVENQLKSTREKAETLQTDLLTPQTDEGMAKGMQADIVVMDKCQMELKIIETEVSKLEADLPPEVSSYSLEEAMKLQDDLRKEAAGLRQSIKSRKTALEIHTNKMQELRDKKNELKEQQLKIQAGTQQLQTKQQNLNDLQVAVGNMEEQVQLLKSDVAVINMEYEDARRTVQEVKANNRAEINKENEALNELKRRHREVSQLNQNIADFERRGTKATLLSTQQALADMQRDREELRKRGKELTERSDKLNSEINGQQVHKRELDDNLQLLEKEKEEEKLVEEKAVLVKKLGGSNYDQIVAEKRKLEEERKGIVKESQQAEGRVEELRQSLVKQRQELSLAMYKDAGKKYSQALQQKIVKEKVETDLAKYYKAMEWTMTQFHQERMKVINEIIHDLWRNIYRGNDVDYIKIEANAPDTSDTARRRSYDYRVVQVKNDVEIDMRGRCSAGQKVLACLIIRMALAETLSSQCGILALDEPTTNLDRENIESLADALVQIVNARMVNKGFQLIVITHDEEFVQHMRQVADLTHYHRVTRNEDGKSMIKKYAVN